MREEKERGGEQETLEKRIHSSAQSKGHIADEVKAKLDVSSSSVL